MNLLLIKLLFHLMYSFIFLFFQLTKNGVVTFGGAHPNNTQTTSWDNIPQRFPLPTAHPLIAAYWTNPQITSNGDLWFQQTMDMKTLNIIKHKVQCLYPQNKDLVAKWAFVATWENVNSSETNLLMVILFYFILSRNSKLGLIYQLHPLKKDGGKMPPTKKKGCLGYDTKLHPVMRLQF